VQMIDRKAFDALLTEPYIAGTLFRRALIRALLDQLAYSNTQLAAFQSKKLRSMKRLVPLLLLAGGCSRPPPAPVGLDDSATFLLRNFYEDDATIGAGLTGWVDWYDDEGAALTDLDATAANVSGFQLAQLDAEDVAMLPVDDDGRDLNKAYGVVALADMDCPWAFAEELLVRGDQNVVFEGDMDTYARTFGTPREDYVDASAALEFAGIDSAIPILDPEFDPAELSTDFMPTMNVVTASDLGVTLTYDLMLNFRHGIYEVQGEETVATLIITTIPSIAESTDASTLAQSYSIEVDLDRDGRTFRMLAEWSELDSPIMQPDSPLALSSAVNKIRKTAERMTAICQGDIDIPDEGSEE
jgi:hypothetical protein